MRYFFLKLYLLCCVGCLHRKAEFNRVPVILLLPVETQMTAVDILRRLNLRSARRYASGVFSAAAMVAMTSPSEALPAVQSQGFQSYEYFGLNYADNIDQSFTAGTGTHTLNYDGLPGCNPSGTCSATTNTGASQSASATVNEVAYHDAEGGYVEAELAYFVEINAPGSYSVVLRANDAFSGDYTLSDVQRAQAYLAVGLGSVTAGVASFSSYVVNETDCVTSCPVGVGNYLNPSALPAVQSIVLQGDQAYLVDEWVVIDPWPTGAQLSASVDSSFAGASVPEPPLWGMTLVGFGAIGLARLGRRQLAPAA